jgi:hypothetical protein
MDKATFTKTGAPALLEGTDAKDTNLGAPTFNSSPDLYHAYRIITAADCPPPDFSDPWGTIKRLQQWSQDLLGDKELLFCSPLGYRSGPTDKPIPLWVQEGAGYSYSAEVENVYVRQRQVRFASWVVNLQLTGLILGLKSARKNILGLWHDPTLQASYLTKLRKQGQISLELDESAYDSTIKNVVMANIFQKFAERNFHHFGATLAHHVVTHSMSVNPSFKGTPGFATGFYGQVGLQSGWLFTSEIGTIVHVTAVLWALSHQIPDIVKKWKNGTFIMLVQSDDLLFTFDASIDADRLSADLAKLGFSSKLKEGTTFLKKILPLGSFSGMKGPSPLIMRHLQQTTGNEDRYGDKPDAIRRLGFVARSNNINFHPMYSSLWPALLDVYEGAFPFLTDEFMAKMRKGDFSLLPGDDAEILKYAESASGQKFWTDYLERVSYDPSALALLASVQRLGLPVNLLLADQTRARAEYVHALTSKPSARTRSELMQHMRTIT